ncbi:hypothetical protein BT93_E1700, partial [Corymbia citriodora subsp. variegata]
MVVVGSAGSSKGGGSNFKTLYRSRTTSMMLPSSTEGVTPITKMPKSRLPTENDTIGSSPMSPLQVVALSSSAPIKPGPEDLLKGNYFGLDLLNHMLNNSSNYWMLNDKQLIIQLSRQKSSTREEASSKPIIVKDKGKKITKLLEALTNQPVTQPEG